MDAEKARSKANEARQAADAARSEADQAREAADKARHQMKEARQAAEKALKQVDEARQEAAEAAHQVAQVEVAGAGIDEEEVKALRDEVTRLQQALASAEAKEKEAREGFLRANAEMENVRRRSQEEVSKAHKYGIEGFAESMVPVADSLDMALKVDAPSIENLLDGVQSTRRQLTQAFEKHHLTEIDPKGEKFDPNAHQAISVVPAQGVPPNHVATVLQKGYRINDRILRPALVTVSQSS